MILDLRKRGVDTFRINLSHGSADQHKKLIRRAAESGADVLIDLQGEKIRVEGAHPSLPLDLNHGESVCLRATRSEKKPSHPQIWVGERVDFSKLSIGNHVLLDDGNIVLRVTKVQRHGAICVVESPGRLLPRKGVALPSKALEPVLLTERDRLSLEELKGEPFSWTAASFVRNAKQIKALRDHLRSMGSSLRIMAKIEDSDGVQHAESILNVADGLLVARGDLGVSMPLYELPFLQKKLVALAKRKKKPGVVATQMLESMIKHQRPTRAEVTDVANAVLDGASAVMLSAETAVGKYPREAVEMMAKVIAYTEKKMK